jgi:succinoglycan biosynthesis transport protein ExoP
MNLMESTEYPEENIDFQKYWLVLKRRWFPATGVFGIVVVLAALVASVQKPVYEAEGKLLFKQDRSSSLTGFQNNIGEIVRIGEKS